MTDKFLPSEQRGTMREGLSSSTKNFVRSRIEDEKDDSGGGMVDSNVTTGFTSVGLDWEVACIDALHCWDACTNALGGTEAGEVSCKVARHSGLGAVRSNVDAAQSQWVEREW